MTTVALHSALPSAECLRKVLELLRQEWDSRAVRGYRAWPGTLFIREEIEKCAISQITRPKIELESFENFGFLLHKQKLRKTFFILTHFMP